MKTVEVNDTMQKGYSYRLTEPIGENYHRDFKPQLTPKEMLSLGIFGGKYMNDCRDEFPEDWYNNAKLSRKKDVTLNFYGVDASMGIDHWVKKGWIHEDDPRGWFQWYCRYYMGRRSPKEDLRQVKRWKSMARHIGQIKANCEVGDQECRKKQRQAILHWAYDPRKL